VDARLVVHLYEPTRPGQVRGVPILTPVMREMNDLRDFRHAARIAQKMHACILGIVEGGEPDYSDPDDTDSVAPAVVDTTTGEAVEGMEPGMWVQGSGGKTIKVHQPPPAPPSEYVRDSLRATFVGAGVSYEEGAGDYNGASFSASRMSRHRSRRLARIFQQQRLIPMFLDPIATWWLETAQAVGVLPMGVWEVDWIAPPWEEADPGADVEADTAAIELGVMSRQEAAVKRGRTLATILDEEVQWREMRRARGLPVDGDPQSEPTQ
jgi:capsid protein